MNRVEFQSLLDEKPCKYLTLLLIYMKIKFLKYLRILYHLNFLKTYLKYKKWRKDDCKFFSQRRFVLIIAV